MDHVRTIYLPLTHVHESFQCCEIKWDVKINKCLHNYIQVSSSISVCDLVFRENRSDSSKMSDFKMSISISKRVEPLRTLIKNHKQMQPSLTNSSAFLFPRAILLD